MFLNHDGISYNLYKILWKEHNKMWTNLDVLIPDTIIFFKHKPAIWFFSNKHGKIKKKSHHNTMNLDYIYKNFTKKKKLKRSVKQSYGVVQKSDIVAYFVQDQKTAKGEDKTVLHRGLHMLS